MPVAVRQNNGWTALHGVLAKETTITANPRRCGRTDDLKANAQGEFPKLACHGYFTVELPK